MSQEWAAPFAKFCYHCGEVSLIGVAGAGSVCSGDAVYGKVVCSKHDLSVLFFCVSYSTGDTTPGVCFPSSIHGGRWVIWCRRNKHCTYAFFLGNAAQTLRETLPQSKQTMWAPQQISGITHVHPSGSLWRNCPCWWRSCLANAYCPPLCVSEIGSTYMEYVFHLGLASLERDNNSMSVGCCISIWKNFF